MIVLWQHTIRVAAVCRSEKPLQLIYVLNSKFSNLKNPKFIKHLASTSFQDIKSSHFLKKHKLLVSKLLKIKIALRHFNQRKALWTLSSFLLLLLPFALCSVQFFNTQLIWMILIIYLSLWIFKGTFNKKIGYCCCVPLQLHRRNFQKKTKELKDSKFILNSTKLIGRLCFIFYLRKIHTFTQQLNLPYINLIPLNLKLTEKNNLHPIWSRKR